MDFDMRLEPCVLTEKEGSKTLPCRNCGRPCVVTRFAAPAKTECTFCRKGEPAPELANQQPEPTAVATAPESEPEFDESLEPERLTDKEETKDAPCRKCRRRCVVTRFATLEKVECLTCRGIKHQKHKERVLKDAAETVNPAKLEKLADGLINPPFRVIPPCPFDPEHEVELKHITHSANYGPRHLEGYGSKGMPRYHQETGECVNYQCNDCRCVISYSTQHPMLMRRQNEVRELPPRTGSSAFEAMLGERTAA